MAQDESTRAVCVDASFALRLVIPHPVSEGVAAVWERWVREDRRIVAPRLWVWEVTNGLWRATLMARDTLPVDVAWESLEYLLALPVELQDVERHLERLWREVLTPRRVASAYDACYLVTARVEEAELWTCDQRLARSAQGTGIVRLVE